LHCFSHADKVFGPATTTRHVYDVAAQHVVSGAMDGINGMFECFDVQLSCCSRNVSDVK
jgi:centromeric protein E